MSVGHQAIVSAPTERWVPPLPSARGRLTEWLFTVLRGGEAGDVAADASDPGFVDQVLARLDPLADDDFQLALYASYETHYRGFAGVDDRWEWDPGLLAFRTKLERAFEHALRARVGDTAATDGSSISARLRAIANQGGPSISRHLKDKGSLFEMTEFLIHKSPYQLKEFDPQSWVIPRLEGRAKGALLEVAFDEFGCGRAERIHARLFHNTMEAMGLDGRYGAYLDCIPGVTLAPVNLMSMFGLHRRLRGASLGHLVIGELTSALSTKRSADALRRLGYGPDATHFFDEHVLADSVHDMIMLHDLAGAVAADDPHLVEDMVFGAAAGAVVDGAFAEYVLGCWARGEQSLRVRIELADPPVRPSPHP
jgi:hypothetical protein